MQYFLGGYLFIFIDIGIMLRRKQINFELTSIHIGEKRQCLDFTAIIFYPKSIKNNFSFFEGLCLYNFSLFLSVFEILEHKFKIAHQRTRKVSTNKDKNNVRSKSSPRRFKTKGNTKLSSKKKAEILKVWVHIFINSLKALQ